MNTISVETYNKLRKVRDAFKKVNQISYNISQIDRRFPLETLDEQSLLPMLNVYKDFLSELKESVEDINKSLKS